MSTNFLYQIVGIFGIVILIFAPSLLPAWFGAALVMHIFIKLTNGIVS